MQIWLLWPFCCCLSKKGAFEINISINQCLCTLDTFFNCYICLYFLQAFWNYHFRCKGTQHNLLLFKGMYFSSTSSPISNLLIYLEHISNPFTRVNVTDIHDDVTCVLNLDLLKQFFFQLCFLLLLCEPLHGKPHRAAAT